MKISKLRHLALQGQESLLKTAQKSKILGKKFGHRPAHTTARGLAFAGDKAVLSPAKALGTLAWSGVKETGKTGAWAAKGVLQGAKIGTRGIGTAAQGLQRVPVSAQNPLAQGLRGEPVASALATIELGLAHALTRAEHLAQNPPSIAIDKAQYAKLGGIILAEKIPKAMLIAAAVHSFGLGATFVGHLLAPASEEALLHAAGFGSTAAQVGTGVGLAHALHGPLSRALHKSGILQKDREYCNYTRELGAARSDIEAMAKSLRAMRQLTSRSQQTGEKASVSRRKLRTIARGTEVAAQAALLGERRADTLYPGADRPQYDAKVAFNRAIAGRYIASFALPSGAPATSPATPRPSLKSEASELGCNMGASLSSVDSRTWSPASTRRSSLSTPASSAASDLASLHAADLADPRQQATILRADRHRHLDQRGVKVRQAGLEQKRNLLLALGAKQGDSLWLQSELKRVQLRLEVERARLATLEQEPSQRAAASLLRAHLALETERSALRHAAALGSPTIARSLARQYRARASHYEDRYQAQQLRLVAEHERIEKKRDDDLSIDERKRVDMRLNRLAVKLAIVQHKYELAQLDADFSAHLAGGALPDDSVALANRAQYLRTLQKLHLARQQAALASDAEKRSSQYTTADEKLLANSPALVRAAASIGQFAFGVMPIVNLPWWATRWGSKKLASSRLDRAVAQVNLAANVKTKPDQA